MRGGVKGRLHPIAFHTISHIGVKMPQFLGSPHNECCLLQCRWVQRKRWKMYAFGAFSVFCLLRFLTAWSWVRVPPGALNVNPASRSDAVLDLRGLGQPGFLDLGGQGFLQR